MTRFWFRSVVGTALFDHPVILADDGVAVQVNSVPVTFDVSVRFVAVLLQICMDNGTFDRLGVGNTVTTYGVMLPLHPFAVGITW